MLAHSDLEPIFLPNFDQAVLAGSEQELPLPEYDPYWI